MTDLKILMMPLCFLMKVHFVIYGNKNFDNNMNISILTATIKFIKDTERFDQPLFNYY